MLSKFTEAEHKNFALCPVIKHTLSLLRMHVSFLFSKLSEELGENCMVGDVETKLTHKSILLIYSYMPYSSEPIFISSRGNKKIYSYQPFEL